MSDFKGVPTSKLQAEYDASIDRIREIREQVEPLKQELSKRSNARALVLNQVIAGNADALRATGVSEQTIADAEAYVAEEKARKAQARRLAAGKGQPEQITDADIVTVGGAS